MSKDYWTKERKNRYWSHFRENVRYNNAYKFKIMDPPPTSIYAIYKPLMSRNTSCGRILQIVSDLDQGSSLPVLKQSGRHWNQISEPCVERPNIAFHR